MERMRKLTIWMQKNKTWACSGILSTVGGIILATIIARGCPERAAPPVTAENVEQQTNISNTGDGSVSVTQNQGIDPSRHEQGVAALAQTQLELKEERQKRQRFEAAMEIYKREDKVRLAALQKAENWEKAEVIVRIFQADDEGKISQEEAKELISVANGTPWDDLKALLKDKNLTVGEHYQSLVVSRIFEAKVRGGRYRARYNSPQIYYELTPEGRKLFDIINSPE